LLIKELNELLYYFEDDKDVSVFLELTPNYDIIYKIEDWVDNNGHLDLGILDNAENMNNELKLLV